ncbi:MAG: MFS transporter [Cytophagales bacterium]|nr:MFS transporter [Bernardetiaceae bacterium]MDW8203412.1 MFS transporter [Cytophagales bacterium]
MLTTLQKEKPVLSFFQIWNMSFGFLGIQFGWALQMANMSAIYEYLGAQPENIPMLWLAAPLTGLIVQPIIGYLSDRTWTSLGRRKPYFLTGAILSSIALVLMPNSSALWMAAGLLWVLDASINISMEPFRAFVADMLPPAQQTQGYAMQSFFIGLGAVIASALPWMLENWFHIADAHTAGSIPATVRISFYLGAGAFFFAVLYTILTTREYPPDDIQAFKAQQAAQRGFWHGVTEIFSHIWNMPKVMRQLALVQFCTWPGLFLMWFYFSVAVARNIFGATDTQSPQYAEGIAWAGICFAFYSLITFLFSPLLPAIANRIGRKFTHAVCLLAGAAGLWYVGFASTRYELLLSMTGVGIAWASILAMPYAMLVRHLPPEKTGIYMGIFNFFIVLPEIIASLFFGKVMETWLNNDRIAAVTVGGSLLCIAAIITLFVHDSNSNPSNS